MNLIFIRHGDPDYSIDSLTEKGWREANFFTVVISASLANSVRHLVVTAVGTFYHSGDKKLPVSSSLISSCFRSFSLWNCHS